MTRMRIFVTGPSSKPDIDFPVEKELEKDVSGENEEGALSWSKTPQSISKTTPDTGAVRSFLIFILLHVH